ncbi:MAG: Fic family protein [bacterium]
MIIINQKQKQILLAILKTGSMSSSDVHAEMIQSGEEIALITIKRALSQMGKSGLLAVFGSGPSTHYKITVLGRLCAPVDARRYCAIEPDKRYGLKLYNFDLLLNLPDDLFTNQELKKLNDATAEYKQRIENLSPVIQKKELERLIIELSWKSSKIEGNTYTLLDTEKLILENKKAAGHSRQEAQMILNHKDAFNFIRENAARFIFLTKKNLEDLHAILVKNLAVGFGLRKGPVGIVGSIYRPLDNFYQINEAVNNLGAAIKNTQSPYSKALMALLGIGYIQPFEDGNKRTARLMANAILMAHHCAPLSYRSVDEIEYREAALAFYELNSVLPLKKIFIDQYEFAAKNYAA